MKATAIMTGMLLAGCAILFASCTSREHSQGQELVFLCEDDGGLVERHVGVADVYTPYYNGSPMWAIKYTDGHTAYYHQPQGETCFTEIAAFKAD